MPRGVGAELLLVTSAAMGVAGLPRAVGANKLNITSAARMSLDADLVVGAECSKGGLADIVHPDESRGLGVNLLLMHSAAMDVEGLPRTVGANKLKPVSAARM